MKSISRIRLALGVLLVPAVAASWAWAQTGSPGGSTAPALPGPVSTPPGGENGWLPAVILVVGLIVMLAAIAKVIDLKSKRETEEMQLQAQIADALLRDRTLGNVPVVPTAHIPMLKGSPATVEVLGQVPNPDLREAALRIVEKEASRIRPDIRIEDRLQVVSSPALRAA